MAQENDQAWNEQRERFERFVSHNLAQRARMQGWLNNKGELTAAGSRGALEFVIGMAAGLHMTGHPASQWMMMQAFLASARGVEERFPLKIDDELLAEEAKANG